MNADQLSKLLESTQGHIRAFDTKAQIALGLDSLLAGLVGTELPKGLDLATWHFSGALIVLLVFSTLSLTAAVTSALCAIFTVVPRLHLNQPKSHFFFCHLVELYGRNYRGAADALIALDENQIQHELATQVQTNAVIANVKAARSKYALRLMTASLVLYIMTIIPFCIIAYRGNQFGKAPAAAAVGPAEPK